MSPPRSTRWGSSDRMHVSHGRVWGSNPCPADRRPERLRMDRIVFEALSATPVARQAVELVERKGLGHPDTICDLLAEAISRDLCRRYVELSGRVLHHNIENAFLVAGSSVPELGGGDLKTPIRFI